MLHAQVMKERALAIEEAKGWIGTPYHTGARVKGHGADCLTFVVQVYQNLQLIRPYDIPYYPADWHMHSDDQRYLDGVLEFFDEVPAPPVYAPLPADLVLFKFGRGFSHGAIIVDWPLCIHASMRHVCSWVDVHQERSLSMIGENVPDKGKPRPQKFFALKRWLHGSGGGGE